MTTRNVSKSQRMFTVRAALPSDTPQLERLVAAHVATDPGYAPRHGQTPNEWLAGGVGPCLTRIVAVTPTGEVIGHIAVGWLPPTLPQTQLFRRHIPPGRALTEIRRGVVHPDWVGDGVGGALSRAAMRWVRARGYTPVAATLPDRDNSNAMLAHYQWRNVEEFHVDGYGVVRLWVPPVP